MTLAKNFINLIVNFRITAMASDLDSVCQDVFLIDVGNLTKLSQYILYDKIKRIIKNVIYLVYFSK